MRGRRPPHEFAMSIAHDVDEEILDHLRRRTAALVAAGLDEADARTRAVAEFGDVSAARHEITAMDARAEVRRSARWLRQFGRDLRHGLRVLQRTPGLAAVVIVSLAIGIGVNTTVFSWIEFLVLKPLPGVEDARGVSLIEPRAETGSFPGVSWLEFRDLQAELTTFRDVFVGRMVPVKVGDVGRSERKFGLLVSGNYFSELGVRPMAGRLIGADDAARPGGAPVAVASFDYWRAHLGASIDAIGRPIRVNDRVLTLIGVAPEGFIGTVSGLSFDLFVPATLAPELLPGSPELTNRGVRGYAAMGRLKPGVTLAQAQADVDNVMRRLARDFPSSNATMSAEVRPFWKTPRGPRQFLVSSLLMLQGAMLVLLLAICGNIATLLLARATSRTREVSVRLALGAGPGRIVSLLLAESLVLAGLGAVLGVMIAFWGTEALRNDLGTLPRAFPLRFDTGIGPLALAIAAGLGLVGGVLFGVAPAVQLARLKPQHSMRPGASASSRSRMRDLIMAGQVALALMVLVVAGLFFRTYLQTIDSDPGFVRAGVHLSAIELRGAAAQPAKARQFAADLLEKLQAVPGVDSVALATSVPLDIHGMPMRMFSVEGHARDDGEQDKALSNTVTPGYFATMRIPVVEGSTFTSLRDPAAPPQAIVNQEFVRRFVANHRPLGLRIENGGREFTITGVVANSLYDAFGEPPTPMIYFSYRDRPAATAEIHVRTHAGGEAAIAPEIQRAVRSLDPDLPVFNPRSLSEHVDSNLFYRRIPARMFVVLGPLLLVLTAVGIYAVVSYAASQRTTEVGVRLALGATPRRVIAQLLNETMRVIAGGAGVGWLAAWWITGRFDVPVFASVPVVLLIVAAIACWLPARRATRIDPLRALRQE